VFLTFFWVVLLVFVCCSTYPLDESFIVFPLTSEQTFNKLNLNDDPSEEGRWTSIEEKKE
jgi:hypothetical protein